MVFLEYEMQYGEVCRHGNSQYEYRCDYFVNAYDNEDIEEYYMQQIINEMAEAKASHFPCGSLRAKCKISCHEKVAYQTCEITDGISHGKPNTVIHKHLQ